MSDGALVERMRGISSSLAMGLAENVSDPLKLLDRIEQGIELIQAVECKRSADIVEELSKTPKTTWGQVRTAVGKRDPRLIASIPNCDRETSIPASVRQAWQKVSRSILHDSDLDDERVILYEFFHGGERAWTAARCTTSSEQVESWQPIATAPKDGTFILTYGCTLPTYVYVIVWEDGEWKYCSQGGGWASPPSLPSWWMPLPKMPEGGEA